MRRSTFAVLLLASVTLMACAKKSSLYLDSGRSESTEPPSGAKAQPAPAPGKPPGPK